MLGISIVVSVASCNRENAIDNSDQSVIDLIVDNTIDVFDNSNIESSNNEKVLTK